MIFLLKKRVEERDLDRSILYCLPGWKRKSVQLVGRTECQHWKWKISPSCYIVPGSIAWSQTSQPAFPSSHKTFSLLPVGAPKGDPSGHLQHVHTANSHNSCPPSPDKKERKNKIKKSQPGLCSIGTTFGEVLFIQLSNCAFSFPFYSALFSIDSCAPFYCYSNGD